MKKRIVHIIHNLEIGGVETAILSSLDELNQSFDFTLVCIGSVNKEILEKLSPNIVANTKQVNNLKRLNEIIRFFRSYPNEIVISSLWKSHIFHFLIKHICRINTSVIFLHSTRFAHFIDKCGILLGLRVADEVWADSQSAIDFIAPYHKTGLPAHKISFILQHFTPKLSKPSSKTHYKFVFLGRLSSVKRLDLVVQFIYELRQYNINATLGIYGPDDSTLKHIEANAARLGIADVVTYKGICNIEQVEAVLHQYDCFVMMSDYEGMSISTVQAMESGLLCFLRNVGEIANYGEDMINAVILKSSKIEDWNAFIQNSVQVLTNEALQYKLLSNSTTKFANQLTYTQDIRQNLHRLLNSGIQNDD
jgi:glycosyltransferase involved in cell wall biosynthesis